MDKGTLKLAITSATAIAVAWVGAVKTAQATDDGLDRAEVRTLISTESPYIQDRSLLLETLQRHEALLIKIDGEVRRIQLGSTKDREILKQLLERRR